MSARSPVGGWLLLILSMAVASVAVLTVGALFRGGAWFTPVVVSMIAVIVALATAVAGVVYLPFRDSILRPTFPYLRWGYLWVAAPGLPFALLGLLVDVDDFPLVQMVAASMFFEAVALTGAIFFVIVGRALGVFDVELARLAASPDRDHVDLQVSIVVIALILGGALFVTLPPSHRGLVGSYHLEGGGADVGAGTTLQLRPDGSYRLCSAGCSDGSYAVEESGDRRTGWVTFDGGPMIEFLSRHQLAQVTGGQVSLQLSFQRQGIEMLLAGDAYFAGGCYLGLICA